MEKVVYAGVGKTEWEIRAGLAAGIGYFNIESEPEFEAIARLAKQTETKARAALRLNPDVDPHTHAYTATGTKSSKFGVDIQRAIAFFERYGKDEFLKLDALHLHLGSPIYETRPYVEAVTKTLALIDELANRGFSVATLDIGGGFAADYETDRSPRAADYAAAIVPLLRERVTKGLKIILEPGRMICANAGLLLTRVLYVKDGAEGRKFLICDAGMNTLIRPSLYGAFHFVWPAAVEPRFEPPRRGTTMEMPGLIKCDVVGPICESGDFLAKDRALPPVKAGDLIAVFGAGAYGMVMASVYNTQPRPAEVLIEGETARMIRKRETVSEILAPEL
jgi:diaminopimelate decarboxylase